MYLRGNKNIVMTALIIITVILFIASRLKYAAKLRDENDQVYEHELRLTKGTI